MFTLNDFLGKNYYETMIILQEYNHSNEKKIHIAISKINNNVKFVKHIHSKFIFYIYLECNDIDISNKFAEILNEIYESDQRHNTTKYFQKLMEDPETGKKFTISHIYQK
jgi:hypothetical protein